MARGVPKPKAYGESPVAAMRSMPQCTIDTKAAEFIVREHSTGKELGRFPSKQEAVDFANGKTV